MGRQFFQCAQRMDMEAIMGQFDRTSSVSLRRRATYRVVNGQGQRVFSVRGDLWITQEHDHRDIVLRSGEGFTLDRPGVAIVYALSDVTFTVGTPWTLPEAASVPAVGHAPRPGA
jgi:hypothetical protein